jgi:uncharacterized membrane protein YqgA involved in biofilm formation
MARGGNVLEDIISHIPCFGTLLNTATATLGGLAGLAIHSRLPERFKSICFQALGLFTLFAGISMALSSKNMIIMVLSIVGGSIAGELLKLDDRVMGLNSGTSDTGRLRSGFITAALLYCTGTLGVLGAIEEGLGGVPNLLIAKSLLDGIASMTLASSLGAGVVLAAIPLLIYQGSITIFAFYLQNILSEAVINEVSGVGGLILIGMALSILEIKKLRVMNMLPSIIIAFLLAMYFIN